MKHDGNGQGPSPDHELDDQQPGDGHEDAVGLRIRAHLFGDRVVRMPTAREAVDVEENALHVHCRSFRASSADLLLTTDLLLTWRFLMLTSSRLRQGKRAADTASGHRRSGGAPRSAALPGHRDHTQ